MCFLKEWQTNPNKNVYNMYRSVLHNEIGVENAGVA